MAFDWSQVEGYRDDLSADEKLALLDSYEQPKPNPENNDEKESDVKPTAGMKGYIPKAQYDKLSSEVADLKRQLKGKMSEAEQQAMDRQAEQDALKQELETLRREKTISAHRASFLAQGYDDVLAEQAAVAMADGDTDTVFTAMKKHQALAEKALRAQIMKETPTPPGGDPASEEAKKKAETAKLKEYFGLT